MKLQNISRSSQAFGIKMVNYLQAVHNASIKNGYDREKSQQQLAKMSKILPDYTLTTAYFNGTTTLKLENFNEKTGTYHAIQLYNPDNSQARTPDDVQVENLENLVNGLTDIYGDTSSIGNENFKVTSPLILENEKAQEIIKKVKNKVVPKLEEYFSLSEPYSIEFSTAENKGKILYLTSRTDDWDNSSNFVSVKENIKIQIKVQDKAGNPTTYTGYFYLPEDLNNKDDVVFWTKNFEETLMDILKGRYPETFYN